MTLQLSAPPGRRNGDKRELTVQIRLLLYLSCLGIDDIAGLGLVAECLRRTGPETSNRHAMRTLRGLLRERGLEFDCLAGATHFHSFPPIRRKTMIAQPMGVVSLAGSARKLVLRLFRKPSGGSRRDEREGA